MGLATSLGFEPQSVVQRIPPSREVRKQQELRIRRNIELPPRERAYMIATHFGHVVR